MNSKSRRKPPNRRKKPSVCRLRRRPIQPLQLERARNTLRKSQLQRTRLCKMLSMSTRRPKTRKNGLTPRNKPKKIEPMLSHSRKLSLAHGRRRARNRKYPIIPDWLHDEYAREFGTDYETNFKPYKIKEYEMYDSLPPSIRAIWREKGRVVAKEAYRQSRLGEYERAKAALH